MANMDHPTSDRKLVVVTGASSGIGYEIAKVFAKKGFDLLICADEEAIQKAASDFRELGVEVEALKDDLTRPTDLEHFANRIQSRIDEIEAIAINAGIGVSGAFAETSREDERKMIDLNILSTWYLAKTIVPEFVSRGDGKILFTSSVAADTPGPYFSVYAATKAFIQSLSEGIREEVKDQGVTVTALQPGPTDTNFFKRAHMLNTPAGKARKDDPAKVAQDGVSALLAGKDHVVAGAMKNKVQSTVSKLIPETTGARMTAKQTRPKASGKATRLKKSAKVIKMKRRAA